MAGSIDSDTQHSLNLRDNLIVSSWQASSTRPAGINSLFPRSRPTLQKGAAQKILVKIFILFHKINFFPPVLPIKKITVWKGKHGIYFVWPKEVLDLYLQNPSNVISWEWDSFSLFRFTHFEILGVGHQKSEHCWKKWTLPYVFSNWPLWNQVEDKHWM